MDTQLDLWEVFIQNKAGSYVHAGSVHASDGEMALQNARDTYTRRKPICFSTRPTIKSTVTLRFM